MGKCKSTLLVRSKALNRPANQGERINPNNNVPHEPFLPISTCHENSTRQNVVRCLHAERVSNILHGEFGFFFTFLIILWKRYLKTNRFVLQSNSKVEKLTKRHATSNDLTSTSIVPKRKRGPVSKPLSSVASTSYGVNRFFIVFLKSFLKQNPNYFDQFQVEAIDNVCQGLEFHILGDDKELENMVKRHGGKVVGYPSMFTFLTHQMPFQPFDSKILALI